MPGEWETHAATWMAWPHAADWPGKAAAIPWVYAEIIRELARVERVELLIQRTAVRLHVRRVLKDTGVDLEAVRFHPVLTDRSWARDMVPTFVRRPDEVAMVDWRFNAWARYPEWRHDNAVGAQIARRLRTRRFIPRHLLSDGRRRTVVLEGGAIDGNGQGLLLTTEECLLGRQQARNPGISRRGMESVLRAQLGVVKVLWLGRGILGDDTHGHIDDVARFVGPRTVVAACEEDAADANYAPLADNLRRLRSMTDVAGRALRVVTLPMPAPRTHRGERLPASYVNFYVANGLVLVPTFNDPADRVALQTLARLFPRRRVVGIHSADLVVGRGSIHCITQPQPFV